MGKLQIASTILMVRPANFGYNAETAVNNAFQTQDDSLSATEIKEKALVEFDGFVDTLRSKGVEVLVYEDEQTPIKPDAIFPNNWVSFHQDGTVILYPMFAPNRRIERSQAALDLVFDLHEYQQPIDFSAAEKKNIFLEGTGSLILDRVNRLAYACLSPRTHESLLDEFCRWVEYEKVCFEAVDENGQQIYHTNVMMALGNDFVVICMDAISDKGENEMVRKHFINTKKTIVDITFDQMNQFAGNMLQVSSQDGTPYLVMSQTAYNCLREDQIAKLTSLTELLPVKIGTIEKYGGGSARCMMAEVFFKKTNRGT